MADHRWRSRARALLTLSAVALVAALGWFFLGDPLGLPDDLLGVLDQRASVIGMVLGGISTLLAGIALRQQRRAPAPAPSADDGPARPVLPTSAVAALLAVAMAGLVTVAALAVFALWNGQAPQAGPAYKLGEPDFDGYCRAAGRGPVKFTAALDAYGFHCRAGSAGLDGHNVCAWTYRTQAVADRIGDFHDPGSWECWRAPRGRLGPLDFTRYCAARGATARLEGDDAYGWRCDGALVDSQAACAALYPGGAVSRFQNFNDPRSWECWG
ncbi:hypothetical protein C1I98_13095 [Spongiactinospora gelatinilytica]|uniref:Uncharacterized protein n=1 Tax=Spongiactinospora gelatinilytica TaxID=2666298 RepID=A0A2W2HBK9_9ACTN|nr:hypothetical protein [Spongiactinospora gelatinilytica]PZG47570.1 hypothetical protein C1I98_13095 [Spongiactinospora gelatinilytica]